MITPLIAKANYEKLVAGKIKKSIKCISEFIDIILARKYPELARGKSQSFNLRTILEDNSRDLVPTYLEDCGTVMAKLDAEYTCMGWCVKCAIADDKMLISIGDLT